MISTVPATARALMAAHAVITVFALVAIVQSLRAQPPIAPSRDAVTLRRLWIAIGGREDEYVGHSVVALGDIDGDSLSDFGVTEGSNGAYAMFRGGRPMPKATPAFRISSAYRPAIGRFRGDGRKYIAVLRRFGSNDAAIDITPIVDGMPAHEQVISMPAYAHDMMLAADLDGDGDDELIVRKRRASDGAVMHPAQLRIHAGGPGFPSVEPTVILPDTAESGQANQIRVVVSDIDADGRPDLVATRDHAGRNDLMIWFGDLIAGGSPRWPDRTIPVSWTEFAVLDSDGDRIPDIAAGKIRMYMSRRGKSPRTRSYADDDADVVLQGSAQAHGDDLFAGGHLNDRRHEALMMRTVVYGRVESTYLLSGGPNGPDSTFEGAVRIGENGAANGVSLGDCNGDGWDDYLTGGIYEQGSAAIIAGGPYIPRDATSSVVDIAADGRADALSIWPQPASDVVNIAWRGDLRAWPRSIVVSDLTGRRLASGEIDDGAPAATWDCSSAAPGVYFITIRDRNGNDIANVRATVR